ncbi:MAG TPA: serine/threonine-protein kinase [Gemmatimonadales bacterium]|nr:serine/threonine-protein kinase [Gemmatimonadales bacterium]
MTRSVCSTCQASIPPDAPHCPRCGPQSLTLIVSEETEAFGPAPAGAPAGAGADPDVAVQLARALGREYAVARLLGRGGFAEVYEVHDTALQRRLAVKVLRPGLAWTSGMLARFKQEARSIARLSHPHTVPIHFVGEGEGLVFYAMPYIEGRTLGELLHEHGALAVERAVALALPLLDALEHAHRHGLVHRDLKPDNVMVEERTGRPLLLDFGIAKCLDGDGGHQTLTGYVVGTPLYMSPEQALGQRGVDARSDLYAFGAVLYQMLTGAPPFEGATSQEIVSRHLTEPAPAPSLRDPRVPRWLSDVVQRCMAKRPDDRYPSAAAVAEALRAGAAVGARTEPLAVAAAMPEGAAAHTDGAAPAARPRRSPARRRVERFLGVATALTVVGIGTAVASRPRPVVTIENRLAEPVRVSVAGAAATALAPGDSVRVTIRRGEGFAAEWRLVRPVDAGGRPLGEELGGRIRIPRVDGGARRYIDLATLDARYFAPVVANHSGVPLRVRVLAGPADAPDCDCTVAPGATRAHLGYYPLLPQSAVVVRDTADRTARFDGLAATATVENGLVTLAVDSTHLRAPAPVHLAQSAGAAARPSAERARVRPPAPAAPADTSLVADSAGPSDTTAMPDTLPIRTRPADDPLRGIFPHR